MRRRRRERKRVGRRRAKEAEKSMTWVMSVSGTVAGRPPMMRWQCRGYTFVRILQVYKHNFVHSGRVAPALDWGPRLCSCASIEASRRCFHSRSTRLDSMYANAELNIRWGGATEFEKWRAREKMSWNGRRRRSLRFCGSLCTVKKKKRERQTLSFPPFVCGWNDVTDHWLLLVAFCCLFMLDVVPIVVDQQQGLDRQNVHDRSTTTAQTFSDADERPPVVICTHTPGRNQMTGAVAQATTVSWQHHAVIRQSPIAPAFVFHVKWGVWGCRQKSAWDQKGEI